jgi:hypothetical protein
MQLYHNLYQDEHGHWHLRYRGEELKIATRNGRTNEYHVDLTTYCPDLLPHMGEFLDVYRKCLPNAETASSVFLTRNGRPFTGVALYQELRNMVLRRIDRPFYPHLIRSIWTTEYMDKTNNATTASHVLGDTVATVLKNYQEIREQEYPDKAREFLAGALSPARQAESRHVKDVTENVDRPMLQHNGA